MNPTPPDPMTPPTKPTIETCASLIRAASDQIRQSANDIEQARTAHKRACASAKAHSYTANQLREALAALDAPRTR